MKREGDRTHEPGVGLPTVTGGNLENCGVKLDCAQYREGTGPEGSTSAMTRDNTLEEIRALLWKLDDRKLRIVYQFIKRLIG